MDGVLADFTHTFTSRVYERYEHVNEGDIDESKFFIQEAIEGVDPQELIDLIAEKGFFYDHPPIDGAIEAFNYMLEHDDYDPYIVTSPGGFHFAPTDKYRWVQKHLGDRQTKRLVIARDKSVVQGDFLIDDRTDPTNEHRASWRHILYTQPYNLHIDGKPRLTWDNWEEVLNSL